MSSSAWEIVEACPAAHHAGGPWRCGNERAATAPRWEAQSRHEIPFREYRRELLRGLRMRTEPFERPLRDDLRCHSDGRDLPAGLALSRIMQPTLRQVTAAIWAYAQYGAQERAIIEHIPSSCLRKRHTVRFQRHPRGFGAMQIGVFIPIGNNGWLNATTSSNISRVLPSTDASPSGRSITGSTSSVP